MSDQSNLQPRAYAQWVSINNFNYSTTAPPIVIKNVSVKWGKFYQEGNKDKEIPVSAIQNKVIYGGESFKIYACGRENASSGTESSYELFDKNSDKIIRRVYLDCPWGSKKNTFTTSGDNSNWISQQDGGNYDSGALGDIKLTLVKLS
ncbi:Aegerolysin aa-Pri1 [Crepidotus variabilis]|uniref:Aegerolysin aa-Pri1 n=1 Tax=Crepidotus variabilis TaxID=179855 RepID=A0A9P6JM71_9AGAR|nr:Aegerolysin aa-Pri1 [Crepidotus variabilis]